MILLDTNVVSELMLPEPHPGVAAWLAAQDAANVFLSVISEAELRYGVAILPSGARRNQLATELDNMLGEDFRGRVLPFDRDDASRLRHDRSGTPCRRPADQPRRLPDSRHCPCAWGERCHQE